MVMSLNGRVIIPIGDALRQVGISRATYFRWIKQGRILDAEYRDRNGHRILTVEEIDRLKRYANQIVESSRQLRIPLND